MDDNDLNDFFKTLARYKYGGEDDFFNWEELKALFAHFPDRPLQGAENVLAVHLILETCSQMHWSCGNKGLEFASDLRGEFQERCLQLLQRSATDLTDYLALLIDRFALREEDIESAGLDKWVSFSRPWVFYFVEGTNFEPDLRILNKDADACEIVAPVDESLLRIRDPKQLDYMYILDCVINENTKFWLSRSA